MIASWLVSRSTRLLWRKIAKLASRNPWIIDDYLKNMAARMLESRTALSGIPVLPYHFRCAFIIWSLVIPSFLSPGQEFDNAERWAHWRVLMIALSAACCARWSLPWPKATNLWSRLGTGFLRLRRICRQRPIDPPFLRRIRRYFHSAIVWALVRFASTFSLPFLSDLQLLIDAELNRS